MTTSTLFYGFGAYVGRLNGLRQVEWWPDAPATLKWDPAKLIATDLAKTPLAVANGEIAIDDIEVDDHIVNTGLTRIGPRYPQGEMVGAIWLAKGFYDALPANVRPPRQSTQDGADYELTSVLYWNGTTPGRRFFGFRGRIASNPGGGITRVEVWHGGRGRVANEKPRGPFDLDFAKDVDPTHTAIGPGGAQDGAIFIEDQKARELQLRSPKIPESSGFDFFPGR